MAIDSRNKRASAIGLCMPWSITFPKPDGVIDASDRIQSAGEYAMPPWKSADSHDAACEEWWNNCANAYDDNTSTYAVGKNPTQFANLDLIFSPAIKTDLWRVWAEGEVGGETHNPDIRVWLYYDGGFQTAWNGEITKGQWYDYPVGGIKRVSKARIQSNDSIYDYLRVYEFQLLDLTDSYPFKARPLVGGSLAGGRTGLI